ncbi:MauE/DoxX family redox-associated membrane protein [Geothrix oryzisoli]|uniref:MauE/DoxX family redox-associated membrane protein n=1 Tax=Geothrix oryzisoli TaxID=2922721 RepID=UPI001FAC1B99|nr:MauE/DoxX family redox-associated membrane protein [Geothrix oryzisoli]
MKPRLRQALRNRWLTLAVRILLGLVFIAAALPKIGDPPAFAKAIWAYQLVPGRLLNPMALALPWLELVCGLALVLGIWVRAAGVWIAALLLSFTLALSVNLGRRHPVDCGCFGATAHRTEAERLADMRWSVLRDAGLLLLCAQLLLASAAPRKP